ncbi:unnamed protein product [Cladocopium goreaui]|uniref:SET domain-containing protein n=1 Tax=Cladocopium goreaui TaxID=2562237 RepID=A0A9P1G9Y4_9DINO|nr:unnamed protein product [Cladocopium goreaui]
MVFRVLCRVGQRQRRSFAQVVDGGFVAPKLKTLEDPMVGKHLVTSETVARSEVLFKVDLTVEDGRLLRDPNMYSLQVSEHQHLDLQKVPDDKGGIARFLSHLDEPNLKPVITDESVTFSAVRKLEPGEELGFHYCTTEWSMASPFECAKDGQSIQGFVYLDAETQDILKKKELLAAHIQRMASKLE